VSTVVIGVRLVGDGSGLVGPLRDVKAELAGVATAEQGAASAATQLTGATSAAAAANDDAATAFRQAAVAANENAAAVRQAAVDAGQYASMAAQLRSAIDPMYAAQQRFNQQMDAAEELLKAGTIAEREYAAAVAVARQQLQAHAGAVAGSNKALNGNVVSAGQAKAGYINLGRQMQDVAMMAAMPGVNLGTIITTQGGQIADAVAMMGGRFSGLASFLAGPWGAAIIVGTGLLANLAQEIWKSGDAADKTKNAHETLADKLNLQKHSWREVIDAMRDYNREAKKAAQSAYDVAEAEHKAAQADLNRALALRVKLAAQLASYQQSMQSPTGLNGQGQLGAAFGSSATQSLIKENDAALAELRSGVKNTAGALAQETAKIATDPRYAIEKRWEKANTAIKNAGGSVDEMAAKMAIINQQRDTALDGLKKHRKPKERDYTTSALKLEDGAEQQLAALANQFAELPTGVEKANAALLKLDAIQKSIVERSKAKGGSVINVDKVLDDAQAVRDAVENSLNKPFRDYIKSSAEANEIDKLALSGREDEAAALKVVLGLQKNEKDLSAAETQQVLETVRQERARSLVLRDQRAIIQGQVQAVQSMRNALQDTIASALKGRLSAQSILSSFGQSAVNMISQSVTESIFGNAMRSIEQQAGDGFASATDRSTSIVTSFADAVEKATARVNGTATPKATSTATTAAAAANDNPIAVNGTVVRKIDTSGSLSVLVNMGAGIARGIGINLPQTMINGLQPTFKRLEKLMPDAIRGAFEGLVVAKAANAIFGKGTLNDDGSQIGAALGSAAGAATGIPGMAQLGAFTGALEGGLIGKLFEKSDRGTSVITSTSKDAKATASTDQAKSGLSTMSNSVQSTLDAIASKFSTTVGDFAVSIGQYKDYYRVSASGSSSVGDKYYPNNGGSDVLYDGTDQSQAIMISIQNAIKDGAIRGLSAAVQKALASSSNIERALAEALKVQEVELAIGGIGATLAKSFTEIDAKAAERVRIAKDYGFDLLAVEKVNAEKRLALQTSLAKAQVGSLQDLLTEMASGSLYEGSLVDQRNAILAKIDAAKVDVAAGKDGAGDTLTKLLEQLNTVSKDAYGTTGAFAADRTLISDTANSAIASANAMIQAAADAAAASATASDATATQLDEANDQLAKIASVMGVSLDYLKAIAANGNSVANLAAMAGY
jgi:hypothetical protein